MVSEKRLDFVTENTAKCSKCSIVKNINEFRVQRSNCKYPYRLTYCNACRTKQTRDSTYKSIEKFLSHRFTSLKAYCKKHNIAFDIDMPYVLDRWHKQKGKCFYTDIPMIWGKETIGRNRYAISFDRIDNTKDYIKGNVVFCVLKVNTAKSDFTMQEIKKWMPNWWKRIQKFRKIEEEF